jgi:hypothetical protein
MAQRFSLQLIEQSLRLLQIARVEAFGEPPVNRSKQFARLLHLALVAPEPRHAHCGAQLPALGLLLTGDRKRLLITQLGRCYIARTTQKFTLQPLYLGFENAFIGSVNELSGLAQSIEAFCWLAKPGKSDGEQGGKVAQNVAAGVAGLIIWPIWFGMDFKDAAGKEVAALQARQQYLTTLATERCNAPSPPPPQAAALAAAQKARSGATATSTTAAIGFGAKEAFGNLGFS